MTDVQLFGDDGATSVDIPTLRAWCATLPPGEEMAATRDEAMRRAEYLAGRDAGARAEYLRAARVVEWEMARQWPANPDGAHRTDDRPPLHASDGGNRQAWQRFYGVGRQDVDWIESLTDPARLTQAAIIAGPRNGAPPINHGSAIEWYTPPQYIEAARRTLDGIDTDPASSAVAQITVRADTYYTKDDDGLAQPWHGSVWLNPPYSAKLIAAFVDRAVTHNEGPVIVLTNNGTDTAWGQKLLRAAAAVCFPDHRLRFLNADNEPQGPAMQGQMFTYLGNRPDLFHDQFDPFGVIR